MQKLDGYRPFLHFSVHPRYLRIFILLFAVSVVVMLYSDSGVGFLPSSQRTNGEETLLAFAPVTERGEASVVQIFSGEDVRALGTVVSPLGYIVTKESEVPENPSVRLPNGRISQARKIATDRSLDLALMFVPGAELLPVRWGRSPGLRKGDWVVSPGQLGRSWVGVISAERREIKRVGGAMGVSLGPDRGSREGVLIVGVVADSPADQAGLEAGDVVLQVDNRPVRSRQALIEMVQSHDPGEEVRLRVARGNEAMTVSLSLAFYSIFDALDRNQMMSGETSDRRNGFPEVIQHVIPLSPNSMGSPLLNLRGEAVGINIARADRVTTFAIPAERVMASVRNMIQSLRGTIDEKSPKIGLVLP